MNFLAHLAARTLEAPLVAAPMIMPRLRSRFETAAPSAGVIEEAAETRAAPPVAPLTAVPAPAPEKLEPPDRAAEQAPPQQRPTAPASNPEPARPAVTPGPRPDTASREAATIRLIHETASRSAGAEPIAAAAVQRPTTSPPGPRAAPEPIRVETRLARAGVEAVATVRPPLAPRAIGTAAAPPEPTINVTIGRIEVRASQSAPPTARPKPPSPATSLEDILRERDGGSR